MRLQPMNQAAPLPAGAADTGWIGSAAPQDARVALVLSGGGARAAYQVGVLRTIWRHLPEQRFPILSGVSAGGVNVAFLAAFRGPAPEGVAALREFWSTLEIADVFRADSFWLASNFLRWGVRLLGGGCRVAAGARSLVDTEPLRALLRRAMENRDGELIGIERNIAGGLLEAVTLTTLEYATGRSITWVQANGVRSGCKPHRCTLTSRLTIDHVMASSALPIFFPAIALDGSWHGDGGVRLVAPFSTAIELGATRILAVSTRHQQTTPATLMKARGYPPPAQILGHLLDSVFLDVFDQDAARVARINALVARLPPGSRAGMRPIEILVLRPSQDLGRLASRYEATLPRALRFATRGLGTRDAEGSAVLSLILFQPDYLTRLIELGESDAEARWGEIELLLRAPTTERTGAGAIILRAERAEESQPRACL